MKDRSQWAIDKIRFGLRFDFDRSLKSVEIDFVIKVRFSSLVFRLPSVCASVKAVLSLELCVQISSAKQVHEVTMVAGRRGSR